MFCLIIFLNSRKRKKFINEVSPSTMSHQNVKRYNNIQFLNTHIKTLLLAPKFCSLCLENNGEFYPLNKELAINDNGASKPLRDVVNKIFNFHIEDIMASGYICEKCTEKIIHCYTFIENTKKLFKVIEYCVTDINSKVSDISQELDDDREYSDANVMIVVEYDTETYNEVDELTSVQNAILTDTPLQKNDTKPIVEENIDIVPNIKKDIDITPTLNIVKHPRVLRKRIYKEDTQNAKPAIPANVSNVKEENDNSQTITKPNISLKNGKLLIRPLNVNKNPSMLKFNIHTCNTCAEIFTSYRKLKEHEKSNHSPVIYKCRICEKYYNTQQYLDMHYKTFHLKERCRYCSELFGTDDGSLDKHLIQHHKKAVSACPHCDLVYYTPEELETHTKSSHNVIHKKLVNNKKQCIMCLRNFSDDMLTNHKCKFACLDCPVVQNECIHYNYLISYREQVLNHASRIKCIDCDYTTKRKELLLCHVNREHLDHHPFTCNDCGTQFYTKLSLKIHISQFHQEYKCEYCDRDFSKTPKYLQSHREICKSVARQYPCDICVASFETKQELTRHTEGNHSEFIYPCSLCKKEFPNETALEEHYSKIHSKVQMKKRRKFIECTLCDINFRNIKQMLEHEKLHKPSETFPCKVCPKSFNTLKQIYIHKQKHYSQKIQCPGCLKTMIVSRYKYHKENCQFMKDIDNKHIICEHCGKEFYSEMSLKNHQKTHSKQIPCDYCNKKLKPNCLKAHIRKQHPKVSVSIKHIYNCDKCEYTAKSHLFLENHKNKVHLKIKPFICNVCNKSFCGKNRLLEHIKTHSENNVCFCPYCGKKYANKVCLKMHVRRHTGEYTYECNICSGKFRSSSIMKTHRLKKHQDKTIACPLCDTMFHLATEMRFHVKKIHWNREEPFDYTQIVPAEYHHLFADRRLQKLGEDNDGIAL